MDAGITLRAFLALPLSRLFSHELSPFMDELRRDYPDIRWVLPTEVHLTLHFFGSVAPEEIEKISKAVGPLTKNASPIELYLERIGGFPNLGRPRVIWVGFGGDVADLKTFHHALEQNLCAAGFESEKHEFKPHLTLGRVREGRRPPDLSSITFTVTSRKKIGEIVLFQSHLTPQGAHYEALAAYPFSKA